MRGRFTYCGALGLLILFSLLISCNGEEICPSYPAKYSYTFSVDDYDPVAVFDYDGNVITSSNKDPDELFSEIFIGQSIEDLFNGQTLVQSFTITSINTIDARYQFDDIDTTLTLDYTIQQAPNFYYVSSEEDSDIFYGGVEIAEDCSFVDVCRWIVFSISAVDSFASNAIDGCYRLSEVTFAEDYLPFVNPVDDSGNQLLLIRNSELYELED